MSDEPIEPTNANVGDGDAREAVAALQGAGARDARLVISDAVEGYARRGARPPLAKLIDAMSLKENVVVVLALAAGLVWYAPLVSTPAILLAVLLTVNGCVPPKRPSRQ